MDPNKTSYDNLIIKSTVHLCNSCCYHYPECPSGPNDAIFGPKDNICACLHYEPLQTRETESEHPNVIFKFSGRDTYKAVKQYIHHGLGLSKEDIQKEIKEEALRYTRNVELDNIINERIENKINSLINDALEKIFGFYPKYEIEKVVRSKADEMIRKAVDEAIRKQFSQALKTGLQGMLNGIKNQENNNEN